MKAIAAVDKNWAIGNKNRLLTSIPADMKFFREKMCIRDSQNGGFNL